MRRFGTQLPQRFMCKPGPQRQPTVSIGVGAALGLAIGMACEPAPDNINVPAAKAKGRKYLVNMRFSVISSLTTVKRRARLNSVGAGRITFSLS